MRSVGSSGRGQVGQPLAGHVHLLSSLPDLIRHPFRDGNAKSTTVTEWMPWSSHGMTTDKYAPERPAASSGPGWWRGAGRLAAPWVLRSEIAIELLLRRFRRPARSFVACSVSPRDFYPFPFSALLFQGCLHAGSFGDDDTAWALRRCIGALLLRRYSSASPPRSVTPADALLGRGCWPA